jgi:hypothetical protein
MAKSAFERKLDELEKLRARGRITEEEYASRRAAILADTSSAPAASRSGSGLLRWGTRGCLGLLAALGLIVILVIVIVAVAVSQAGDSTDDSGGDVRVVLAEGSSGEIAPERQGSRRIRVTILAIVDGAESGSTLLNPDPGKKYWAVEVEVENVGSREVSTPSFKLRDSQDIESDRTFFADVGPNLDLNFNLTPGGKQRGWIVFEIAAEAGPKWLRADPNVLAAYDLYFDAP